jgi:hypothetical protein
MNTTALSACAVCHWLLLLLLESKTRNVRMYISPTRAAQRKQNQNVCAAAGAASYQPK